MVHCLIPLRFRHDQKLTFHKLCEVWLNNLLVTQKGGFHQPPPPPEPPLATGMLRNLTVNNAVHASYTYDVAILCWT